MRRAFFFIIGAFLLESMASEVFDRLTVILAEPERLDVLFYGGLLLHVVIEGAISILFFWIGYLVCQLHPKGIKHARSMFWVLFLLGGVFFTATIVLMLFPEHDSVVVEYDTRAEFIASSLQYMTYSLAMIAVSVWGIRSLKHESVRSLFDR